MYYLHLRSFLSLSLATLLFNSWFASRLVSSGGKNEIVVNLDLMILLDDKVKVVAKLLPITAFTHTFQFSKVIPGDYTVVDYRKCVLDNKAFNKSGNDLPITRSNVNTCTISNAE